MDTSKFLSVGDVIVLNDGMKVYGKIPEKFVHVNCALNNKMVGAEITVGRRYRSLNSSEILNDKQQLALEIANKFESHLGIRPKLNDALKYVESVIANVYGDVKEETFVFNSGDEFVVVKTAIEGGSTGYDAYPDGYNVYCKKLNADGTYNPDGAEIQFYQSGCFTIVITPDKIKPVRKMKMVMTPPTFV
jgi:hypothetical protein